MPLNVLLMLGDHARHAYLAQTLMTMPHRLVGIVSQQRETAMPAPPPAMLPREQALFIRHFKTREEAERRHFGLPALPSVPLLCTTAKSLNSTETARFVAQCGADAVIVFGTALIRPPLLNVLPEATLNLHLGLSPRYRGAAGLFWPFYFLEPACAGTTFHRLAEEPDAGAIVHQCVPLLTREDGIHDVACRALVTAANDAERLLDCLDRDRHWPESVQRGSGKNFLARDFQAAHLRVIYELFDDDIVRAFLDGELPERRPKLVRHPGLTP